MAENKLKQEGKTISSKRFLLRPFCMSDASEVSHYLQDREVAQNIDIPFPYDENRAKEWISSHPNELKRSNYKFAIILSDSDKLIGAIGIHVCKRFENGELRYWIAKPFWNQGYGTEAVGRIIEFGFEELKLHRIYADHISANIASGRIMEKNGMIQEARLREHKIRFGKYLDMDIKGILISDWKKMKKRVN